MKKKILFLAFAALALVACGDHNNEPIDESVMPKGEPTDMECAINIPQSAINVMEMSYAEADSFLTAAGWIKDPNSSPKGCCYVCGDTTDVLESNTNFVPGPRTTLRLYITDDKISDTILEMWCLVSEKPYQQIGLWDAWIHKELKTYEHWRANISIKNDGEYTNYEFINNDHQRFYTELSTMNDNQIHSMGSYFLAKYRISIRTNRIQDHVQIFMATRTITSD